MILKIILVNILVLACILSSVYIINYFLDRELEKEAKKSKKREASERPTKPQVSKPTSFLPEGEEVYGYHPKTIKVARAGSKVGSISKHMKKHGRQSSQYRASVKRKIQPEED